MVSNDGLEYIIYIILSKKDETIVKILNMYIDKNIKIPNDILDIYVQLPFLLEKYKSVKKLISIYNNDFPWFPKLINYICLYGNIELISTMLDVCVEKNIKIDCYTGDNIQIIQNPCNMKKSDLLNMVCNIYFDKDELVDIYDTFVGGKYIKTNIDGEKAHIIKNIAEIYIKCAKNINIMPINIICDLKNVNLTNRILDIYRERRMRVDENVINTILEKYTDKDIIIRALHLSVYNRINIGRKYISCAMSKQHGDNLNDIIEKCFEHNINITMDMISKEEKNMFAERFINYHRKRMEYLSMVVIMAKYRKPKYIFERDDDDEKKPLLSKKNE